MSVIKITAPFDCEIKGLEAVPDEVFSEKIMGDGVAVIPLDDRAIVVSSCEGVLTAFFPTGHAFGITTPEGVEILVHLGINTVELEGNCFEALKSKDDKVLRGEPVLEVDFQKINELGKPLISPVIVLNAMGRTLKFAPHGKVKSGDVLMELESL